MHRTRTGLAVVVLAAAITLGLAGPASAGPGKDGDEPIEVPGQIGPTGGSSCYGPERFGFHFSQWFLPIDRERLSQAKLYVKVSPLELNFMIDLGPQ